MTEFGSTPAPKKGLGARGVFIIIILIVAAIFMLLNLDTVQVNLFGFKVDMWAWVLMLIMFVLGMLLGGAVRGGVRKLRGKSEAKPEGK